MACACKGGGNKTSSTNTYLVTKPNGERSTFKTEVEAAAAAKRSGGTYRKQG